MLGTVVKRLGGLPISRWWHACVARSHLSIRLGFLHWHWLYCFGYGVQLDRRVQAWPVNRVPKHCSLCAVPTFPTRLSGGILRFGGRVGDSNTGRVPPNAYVPHFNPSAMLGNHSLTSKKVYLCGAGLLFAIGQIFEYVISTHLCQATNGKINGALFETLFTLLSVAMIWIFWSSITEDDWPMPTAPSGGYN